MFGRRSSHFIPFLCLRFQGVFESFQQRGHALVLHESHGRRHHPLRPRAPQRRLQQVLQDRRKTRFCTRWNIKGVADASVVHTASVSSDERLYKGPEGPASRQRRRPPQRPQVGPIQRVNIKREQFK